MVCPIPYGDHNKAGRGVNFADVKFISVKFMWGLSHRRSHNQIFVESRPLYSHGVTRSSSILPPLLPEENLLRDMLQRFLWAGCPCCDLMNNVRALKETQSNNQEKSSTHLNPRFIHQQTPGIAPFMPALRWQ